MQRERWAVRISRDGGPFERVPESGLDRRQDNSIVVADDVIGAARAVQFACEWEGSTPAPAYLPSVLFKASQAKTLDLFSNDFVLDKN